MTILEAITVVLRLQPQGLSCKDITGQILAQGLYSFNTPNPNSIVNHPLRRHCQGLDFPSAHPVKHFVLLSGGRGKSTYGLIDQNPGAAPDETPAQARSSGGDLLPEEQMQKYYEIHKTEIKARLLEHILNNDPGFFEELVVKLLLALGYGHGSGAGRVVGRSHDGGIDGIIDEDKLGLDKIYIQAKRYDASHKVDREEVQAFIGAMHGVKKGVFITTSTFTRPAVDDAAGEQEKHVSLIDGARLTELMVACGVGVRCVQSFDAYEIDSDFFDLST